MKTLRELLYCVLLMAIIAVVARSFVLLDHLDNPQSGLAAVAREQIATAEKDLMARVDAGIGKLDSQITLSRTAIIGQVAGARQDVTGTVLPVIDHRLAAVASDLTGQLGAANGTLAVTLGHADTLMDTYNAIPADIEGNRIYQAYLAQGLGTLAATKVFMGDAAKAGRTFDQQFPLMMANTQLLTDKSVSFMGHIDHVSDHYDKLITAPVRWYDRVLGFTPTAARVGLAAVGK